MLGVLSCEILLLLNVTDMDCLYVESCGVSSAEYRVHLVGVKRLSACREFFGVHSYIFLVYYCKCIYKQVPIPSLCMHLPSILTVLWFSEVLRVTANHFKFCEICVIYLMY